MDARDERRDDPDPYTTHPNPTRVVMFLVCLGLMLLGFYLMAISFDTESALLFVAGLVLAGGAFAVPLREGRA